MVLEDPASLINFSTTNFYPSVTIVLAIVAYAVRDRSWKISVDKKLHVLGIISRELLRSNTTISRDQMKEIIFEAESNFNPHYRDEHYLVDRLAQEYGVDISDLRRKRK